MLAATACAQIKGQTVHHEGEGDFQYLYGLLLRVSSTNGLRFLIFKLVTRLRR